MSEHEHEELLDVAPGEPHDALIGETTAYLIGLGLALLLTGVSFWVASTHVLWGPGLWVGLVVLATMPVASVKAQEKVIQVTAERFKFTPSVIELKLGEPVILELTTLDRKHGFQVSDLNIDETVEPGKVTHIRIVPAKAGTFLFHCDIFCGSGHEEMAGTMIVVARKQARDVG